MARSNKMPLNWHKECLYNMNQTLEKQIEELEKQKKKVRQLHLEITYYQGQIERAEDEGKDGFDRDKYMPKKKK